MRSRSLILAAVSVGILGVSACRRSPEPVGETRTTGAPVATFDTVATATALDQITAARCSHAAACNERPLDRPFVGYDQCRDAVRRPLAVELDSAVACPRGVAQRPLEACLLAVQSEACGVAVEVNSLIACRASDLCPR